jgi:dTDP-4-dehydrorhamnose reductase
MINKLILFGSNGMLGRYISTYFKDKQGLQVISISRMEFEITSDSITHLEQFLSSFDLDENTCIINCNGLIPQRVTNKNNSDYYIINTIFPLQLSKICQRYQAKLICPTTDCVFSGRKGNYTESDYHDESNAYGISKSLGEPFHATVIRTSIIGEEIDNKTSFLEFVKNSSGTIYGWNNHYWNGITCYEYCKVIEKIINQNLFWTGTRHLFSPEKKSKYELACIIKNAYQLAIYIEPRETPNKVDKTLTSMYDTNSLFCIPSLEEQIYQQAQYTLLKV